MTTISGHALQSRKDCGWLATAAEPQSAANPMVTAILNILTPPAETRVMVRCRETVKKKI